MLLALLLALAGCRNRDGRSHAVPGAVTPAQAAAEPEDFAPGDSVPAALVSARGAATFFTSSPIDSTVFARMSGRSYKDGCPVAVGDLRYLKVLHRDLSGRTLVGEMVVNQSIAEDLLEIFRALYDASYPIERMRLVDDYDADDETSMQANNTSCFNYRNVASTNILSKHAFGMAVDINPLQNPCVRGARIRPSTATDYVDRSKDFPHKIDRNDFCREVFLSFGFQWGGDWLHTKDYQHFEKRLW